MSFDLPRNVILPVDDVDVRLDPGAASIRARQRGGDRRATGGARWQPSRRCSTARWCCCRQLTYARQPPRRAAVTRSAIRPSCSGEASRTTQAPSMPLPMPCWCRRQCAGGDPHGRAYGQCRQRLFRRRLVRAERFSATAWSIVDFNMIARGARGNRPRPRSARRRGARYHALSTPKRHGDLPPLSCSMRLPTRLPAGSGDFVADRRRSRNRGAGDHPQRARPAGRADAAHEAAGRVAFFDLSSRLWGG